MNDAKIIIIYKTAIIIPDKIYKKNFCHGMKFFGTYTHTVLPSSAGKHCVAHLSRTWDVNSLIPAIFGHE